MKKIPVARPIMPTSEELLPFLQQIDESKIYSNFGPLVTELESQLAKYLSIPQSNLCSCSSATQAIAGLLSTSLIAKSKISTPSWTFTATPASIIQSGFVPNFVDVDPLTWESDILSNGDTGVHVLPFGSSIASSITDQPGLEPVIIDAAASFDSLKELNLPTNRSWAVAVSLHATKLLGAGEGGFVYSNDSEWIERFKAWSNFGFAGTRNSVLAGTNSKMSEYHAAVGLASLKNWTKNRVLINGSLNKCLDISSRLKLQVHPAMQRKEVSPYWIIQLNNSNQKQSVVASLEKYNIEYRNWWSQGAHKMPAYSSFPSEGRLPETNNLAETTLGLPFHLGLGFQEFDRIESALNEAIN